MQVALRAQHVEERPEACHRSGAEVHHVQRGIGDALAAQILVARDRVVPLERRRDPVRREWVADLPGERLDIAAPHLCRRQPSLIRRNRCWPLEPTPGQHLRAMPVRISDPGNVARLEGDKREVEEPRISQREVV